jgi:nicotinamidase-related amidase
MTSPRRALLVIDVQQEYFDGVLQIPSPSREKTLANVLAAMDLATECDLPVVVVQHQLPEGAPVFAEGSASWSLHPEVEQRLQPSWKRAVKDLSSVFAGPAGADVVAWLTGQGVDTVTIVGYMTNNCDLATAVGAEELGLTAEVLSDATGAIHLANEAGKVSAEQLHETLLVLLQSNFAAVASTEAWAAAVAAGTPLPKSDLGTSAVQGRSAFAG